MEIKTVSVIGAGTMGSGIACVIALNGFNVNLIDIKEEFLDKAKKSINKSIDKSLEKGFITEETKENALKLLNFSTDFKTIESSDLVIEAVSESMNIKKKVFEQFNEYLGENAIVASNTSALKISELAVSYKNPSRVIGMHFFNPAVIMKLVELIKTDLTDENVFKASKEFVLNIQKEPVEVKESCGFIVNRVLIPMINEAANIYGEGVASPEDIDKAMELGANHPIGPLALADMIGLDICLAIMETLKNGLNSDKYEPAPILAKLVQEGKLGKKSGEGFHNYMTSLVK